MDKELTVSLELLKDDIAFYKDMLKEVSSDILKEGFSKFPVFIAHQEPIKIGEMIIDASEYSRSYNISATVLEELLEKNIVTKEREESFKAAYKNPEQFLCILLVTEKGASFVFVPFKKVKGDDE
jgi:uncharacterized protein YutE (UPF0331/DUF86 family)